MKDFFGKDLQVGDTVAYIENGYRSFSIGYIEKFTPKQVVIKTKFNTNIKSVDNTIRYPQDIIKK